MLVEKLLKYKNIKIVTQYINIYIIKDAILENKNKMKYSIKFNRCSKKPRQINIKTHIVKKIKINFTVQRQLSKIKSWLGSTPCT